MSEQTATTLQEITGQESGLIIWDDGETWVVNWTPYVGMPRALGPIGVGLGEELTYRRVPVPAGSIRAIRDHEREEGGPATSRRSNLRAWRVNDEATVVTSDRWH